MKEHDTKAISTSFDAFIPPEMAAMAENIGM